MKIPNRFTGSIAVAIFLLLSSCIQQAALEPQEKPFRIASFYPPKDLHPLFGLQDIAQYQIYRHPVWVEWSKRGLPWRKPILLESYEISPDGKRCILHLRQDVYFHNGSLMTAEDVTFTYQQIKKSQEESIAENQWLPDIRLETINKFTVKIVSPTALDWGFLLGYPILNADYERQCSGAGLDGYRPIGTGPYRFVEYDSQTHIMKLERFEQFWVGKPPIAKLEIHYFENPESATMALLQGKVDYVVDISPEDAKYISTNPNYQVLSFPQTASLQILLNTKTLHLSDWRVRRALSLLIDRDKIVNDKLGLDGKALAADVSLYYSAPITKPKSSPANTEEAMKLFSEAGWVYNNGKLKKNGKQFELKLLLSRQNVSYMQAIHHVILAWRDAGVLCSPSYISFKELTRKWVAGNYEAIFSIMNDTFNLFTHKEYFISGGKMNYGRFSDLKIDELFSHVKPNITPSISTKRSIQKNLSMKVPSITLFYPHGLGAIHNTVNPSNIEKDPNTLYYLGLPR